MLPFGQPVNANPVAMCYCLLLRAIGVYRANSGLSVQLINRYKRLNSTKYLYKNLHTCARNAINGIHWRIPQVTITADESILFGIYTYMNAVHHKTVFFILVFSTYILFLWRGSNSDWSMICQANHGNHTSIWAVAQAFVGSYDVLSPVRCWTVIWTSGVL